MSALPAPSPHVFDLFAVPGDQQRLPGQGGSVVAGDLVLSPGRDPDVQEWLSPLLARLGVSLDERPGRRRRDLRIAVPVPARNGEWVVEGWAASRYEPHTTPCDDVDVLIAAGRLLHAELDVAVRERPAGLDRRTDRWALAERLVFGPPAALLAAVGGRADEEVVRRIVAGIGEYPLGADQLVHADLAGNVLLDAGGAPVVIDVAPAWRPVIWAEAVAVVDSVLWHEEPIARASGWRGDAERQAMLRALLFRVLSDLPGAPDRYDALLDVVLSPSG